MEKTLSPLHCIFFIYQNFAVAADGVLSEEEKKRISRCMSRWVGHKNTVINEQEVLKIINETIQWQTKTIFEKNQDEKNIGSVMTGTMLSMLDYLKNEKWFHRANREFFLMDIRNIAWADDKFTETEKKWHDIFAESLGLNIRISEMSQKEVQTKMAETPKQKIGFRTERD